MTHVKICCIQNITEAKMALDAGASALGLVAEMPSGPGPISDRDISAIVSQLPAATDTFLLTSRTDALEVAEHLKITGASTVQLVDKIETGSYEQIRGAIPGIRIVQVIHVVDDTSMSEAVDAAPHVDAILLDSGNPNLAVKELGGTGRRHDWDLSRRIVDSVDVPVYLAGGLNPSNAREAIEKVRPYALDICSGVRTNGMLDPDKLKEFFKAVG